MAVNAVTGGSVNVPKTQSHAPKLSLNAQNYLAYLESKFSDVNFYVGSAKFSSGIRDYNFDAVYNCFLCPELIEEMASDADVAAEYERIIWEMRAQMDNLHYGIQENGLGEYVASYAVEINDDGSVDYVIMLRDSIKGLNGNKDSEKESNLPKTIKAKSVNELFKTFNTLFGREESIHNPKGILA
ncbi:MAG: DUF6033 family protein [Oscillospiraceae bacterium]|nr:DUF6033 family protein [Oscillospiraceae bacterium]